MNKTIIFVVLCISIASTSFSQSFRKSSWGDSMGKVKSGEGSKEWVEVPTDEDYTTTIFFEGNIGGLEAVIGFFFVEDKLYTGRYIFIEEHANNNDFLTDFTMIDENLQSKYGSTEIERDWRDDSSPFKNSRDMWGFALYESLLSIHTEWEIPNGTPVTNITHYLYGEDYEITHGLNYFSIELGKRLDRLMKEENVF